MQILPSKVSLARWKRRLSRAHRTQKATAYGLPPSSDWETIKSFLLYLRNANRLKQEDRQKQTLVIIDVQCPSFINDGPEVPKLLQEIIIQIKLARRLGWPIVLVEYEGCSDTHPAVRKALEGLVVDQDMVEVKKKRNGGSEEVLAACTAAGFQTERFRVVGVYTDQCVQSTVAGLINTLPQTRIEIVRRACWPVRPKYWTRFANTPSILLLPPNYLSC